MSSISAVVLSWNRLPALRACLASLRAQSHPVAEVVVVDNGSTDGAREWLIGRSDVTRILLADNTGFAHGMNAGLARVHHPLVLCLADDVALDRYYIERALAVWRAEPRLGLLGGRLVDPWTAATVWSGSRLRLGARGPSFESAPAHGPFIGSDFVPGCLLMVRRDLILDLGGFDENFFSYHEDVDLALRVRRRGWRVGLARDAVAYHLEGPAGVRKLDHDPRLLRLAMRGLYVLYAKHASRAAFVALSLRSMVATLPRLRGGPAGEGLWVLRHLPRLLCQRGRNLGTVGVWR